MARCAHCGKTTDLRAEPELLDEGDASGSFGPISSGCGCMEGRSPGPEDAAAPSASSASGAPERTSPPGSDPPGRAERRRSTAFSFPQASASARKLGARAGRLRSRPDSRKRPCRRRTRPPRPRRRGAQSPPLIPPSTCSRAERRASSSIPRTALDFSQDRLDQGHPAVAGVDRHDQDQVGVGERLFHHRHRASPD